MKPYVCGSFLSLCLSPLAMAVVISPLPPPPPASGEVQTTTTPGAANSQATQALIDQLFNKADYEDFQEQAASPPVFNGDTP